MDLGALIAEVLEHGRHFRLASCATSVNATQVHQGGAAVVTNVWAANTAAAARFVHLYDQSSTPAVASDVPILTIPLAAGASVTSIPIGLPCPFRTGIALTITTDAAAGNNAATAGDVVGLGILYYAAPPNRAVPLPAPTDYN